MQKVFELITEIIGWVQIAIFPTLIGLSIGFLMYYNFDNIYGLVIGCIFGLIGLILGIALATKKFKATGTIHFISRLSATPELDEDEKTENKNSR